MKPPDWNDAFGEALQQGNAVAAAKLFATAPAGSLTNWLWFGWDAASSGCPTTWLLVRELAPPDSLTDWNGYARRAIRSGNVPLWLAIWMDMPPGSLTEWSRLLHAAVLSGSVEMWTAVAGLVPADAPRHEAVLRYEASHSANPAMAAAVDDTLACMQPAA